MDEQPKPNGKHDVGTHRICVAGLVGVSIIVVVGIILADCMGRDVPPSLPGLGGVALGALVNMVAAMMRPGGKDN